MSSALLNRDATRKKKGLILKGVVERVLSEKRALVKIEICSRGDLFEISIVRNKRLLENRVGDTTRKKLLQKKLP